MLTVMAPGPFAIDFFFIMYEKLTKIFTLSLVPFVIYFLWQLRFIELRKGGATVKKFWQKKENT